jgi:hypothetical protein
MVDIFQVVMPLSLKDLSINQSQIAGETVEIRFVPLSKIIKFDNLLWANNAKKHDVSGLWESINKYGFVDIAHFDINLNNGKGGIVFGNGRTEILISALIEAKKTGKPAPKGIPIEKQSGEWCIPISFGVDQDSEAEAIALGIDHNNLTMGSEFSAAEIARMWDEEGYLKLLSSIAEQEITPVSVNAEDLADLLLGVEGVDFGGVEVGESEDKNTEIDVDGIDLECKCPKCGFEFNPKSS